MRTLVVIAASVALVATSVAAKAPAKNDGKTSRAQFCAMDQRLNDFDQNGDGVVSQADLKMLKSQHLARRARAWMSRHDSNNDGQVTKAEVVMTRRALFATLDRDGDGFLSPNERPSPSGAVNPAALPVASSIQNPLDKNGDQRISREEYASNDLRFRGFDTNHDGFLTSADLSSLNRKAQKKRLAHWIAKMDQNGDGKISAAEARAAQLATFDRLDVNGDGYLSESEQLSYNGVASPGSGR